MTTRLENVASIAIEAVPNMNDNQTENAPRRYAECPTCGKRVPLFSHTMQTFCFACGSPVAALDARNMYYEPIKPLADPNQK